MKMKVLFMLIIGDLILSMLAVYTGSFMRLGTWKNAYTSDITRLAVFAAITLFCSVLFELYNNDKRLGKRELSMRIFFSLVASFLVLTSFYYLLDIVMFWGRGIFFLSLGFFGVFQFLWHFGYLKLVNSPNQARRVLVLGAGPLAKKIGELILTTNHQHILRGYVNLSGESLQVPADDIVGNGNGLVATVREEKAHKLVVSLSERRGVFPVQEVMDCKFSGIEVIDAPSFYEEITGKLLLENTTPSWFIFANGFRMTASKKSYKRIFDIMCSLIGLAFALPLLPLVSLIIKIDSRGPVLFKQVRVGEMDKPFFLYKFRTMRQDAEKGTGAVWAQKNDPRVTRIGRWLRKTRIDELPQLFNVLKGDMSFIGPRPERPEFVAELKKLIPYYSERHFVKPGVTGWAQVRYSYGASVEDTIEKLRYDLYYIKNVTPYLDLLIIIETIKVMLFGRGAR